MKKSYYLIVLTLILGLVLTGCLLSNVGQVPSSEQSGITYLTKGGPTETEADEYILYAGQSIDVGVVKVWNDCDYLYVKYEITEEGWCLTETHLHVADDLGLIPQTRKGNPIPGQFDYNDEHECVTEFLYTIPLNSWSVGTLLYIAAQAVVEEVTCFDGTSGLTIEGTEDLNIDGSIIVEALVKVESSETDKFYTIVGKWNDRDGNDRAWLLGIYNLLPCFYISNDGVVFPKAISGEILNTGQWYHLKGTFDSVTGEIKIYVDNVLKNTNDTDLVNIYLNEEPILIGGDRAGGGEGAFFNGCIDEVKVWDVIEENAVLVLEWPETETAWGEGDRFVPKGNWATYFNYTVSEVPIIIDGILSSGEWDCATEIPVTGDMGTVRVLATTDYLYVAFDVVDSNDARTQYAGEKGNDQISINVNPTDGGSWGFPYDLIFETSALSGGCSGSPEDGGHHCLPWNPKVNSGTSTDNWATRWFPNDAQETLPGDLESATLYSGTNRVTEWKLPLASLPSDVLKVGGAIDVGDGNSYVYPVGLDWNDASTFIDILVD